jgi:hypothetical protein
MATTSVSTSTTRHGDRPTARPWRLSGASYKTALTAHILSSVGWFGAAILVAFCAIYSTATNDTVTARAMLRVVEAAPWLTVPLGLVAGGTGLILSIGTKWGIVRHLWVVAKIVITIVLLVTDPLLIAKGAHDAAAHGDAASTLFGPIFAHAVLLAVATLLSTFKPKGLTPYGRRIAAR